jgi:hypothetical protein
MMHRCDAAENHGSRMPKRAIKIRNQAGFFETACITDNAIGAVLLPDTAEQPDTRQRRLPQSTALHPKIRHEKAHCLATAG